MNARGPDRSVDERSVVFMCPDMETTQLQTNALFIQYVDVVNRAIASNRDRFPFKQLLSIGERMLGDKKIGAAVYKTDPDSPHDWFTLTYRNGKLSAQEGKESPDISWKVKEAHLRNVVSNPDPFIANPAKLDLDWLETRFREES